VFTTIIPQQVSLDQLKPCKVAAMTQDANATSLTLQAKEIASKNFLELFISVDPETFPNREHELVEISRFFVNISSSSSVVFWYVEVIVFYGIETLLSRQWRFPCHARSKLFFSLAAHEAKVFPEEQRQSLEIFWQVVAFICEQISFFFITARR
jgi:hypothetical protein